MSASRAFGVLDPRAARTRPPSRRRHPPPMVVAAWTALFFNVLAFAGNEMIVAIPRVVGQMLTQGALCVAVVLALLANRRGLVRPFLFLVLLLLLAGVSLATSLHNEFLLGSTFRACRFVGFVAVLWLLTPYFGRQDMLLLRCHRICLWGVLGSVVVGLAVSPGTALAFDGRLAGALWPIPPTRVAHYAAILLGTSAVLWLCRVVSGRSALVAVVVTGPILILTHTRTALLAALIGLVVAGASLFVGHARVRRTSALGAVVAVLLATVFASQISAWAMRDQSAEHVAQLTGRTKVWTQVFALHRPPLNEMFGSGMSNQSFNGLPVDSSWVATYLDHGWFGLIVAGCLLLVLLLMAITHVRGPHRAVALFLIVYAIVASITETGLGAPSPYMLDLAVACALLASPLPHRSPP